MPKIYLLTLAFLSVSVYGQNIERIVQQARQKIDRVEVKQSDRVTYISSNFAQPQITTTHLRSKVGLLAVTKIYYVYTAYKRSEGFNQKALDRKRLSELKILYPILFESNTIEWELLEQTGMEVHTEGDRYFHGFILIHRPLPTSEGRQKELDLVTGFLDNPTVKPILVVEDPIARDLDLIVKPKVSVSVNKEMTESKFEGGDQALLEFIQANFETPSEVWKNRKDFWAKFTVVVDENGRPTIGEFKEEYGRSVEKSIENAIAKMPLWTARQKDGIPCADTIQFEWRISYSPQLKGMYLKNGKPPVLNHATPTMLEDPTQSTTVGADEIVSGPIFKALDKVKVTEQLAIVMDVTGSMANHIISATYWLNQNKDELPFTSFTVFNDGDDTKDGDKVIGSTGGIYFTSFVSEFSNSIRTAMLAGNGGDYPENDIEAMLLAKRKDTKATGILLIADNFSQVKDFELLNNLEIPVSLLPCGLTGSIQQHYLEIVYKTGGNIYYNDQAIEIPKLSRGDTFRIRKTDYIVTTRGLEVRK